MQHMKAEHQMSVWLQSAAETFSNGLQLCFEGGWKEQPSQELPTEFAWLYAMIHSHKANIYNKRDSLLQQSEHIKNSRCNQKLVSLVGINSSSLLILPLFLQKHSCS